MHVVHLGRDLTPHGYRTRLLAGEVTADEGDMSYYAEERGVEVTLVPAMNRRLSVAGDVWAFWTLFRWFRSERPAIVHTHTAKAGAVGRLAAILAGVPVRIHTYHGHVLGGSYFSALKTAVFLRIERQLARATTRLIVLTHRQKREMSEVLRVAEPERFAVVPLGLELERFVEVDGGAARSQLSTELGIGEEAWVVGIVGRLVPVKNHELFFDALELMREQADGPVHAIVVGAGEREEALRAHVAELGIADAVHWLGWRSDLPEILPACDVCALTSFDEGTPVALIESLAARVPVVSRAVGGVPEVLGEGAYGWLVWNDDPAAFAAALLDAHRHPPDDGARGRGMLWAFAMYGTERLADDIAELYDRELATVGIRPPKSTEPEDP
jgi:glycosyltransferase involved in cell wall biosynthesis